MLVRVLKAHSNGYGETYFKTVGDEYDHPSPELLIARGKLEAADGSDSQTKRVSRARKEAGAGLAKGDGAKRPAKGGKGRTRADGRQRRGKGA